MNANLAWHTTQIFLVSIGGVGLIAFAATLPWWLILLGTCLLALVWFLIYEMECKIVHKYGNGGFSQYEDQEESTENNLSEMSPKNTFRQYGSKYWN